MDSPKQAPPPTFPIEKASTFRSIEVALEEAISRTRDGHVIDAITHLGVDLAKGNWIAADLTCAAVLSVVSDDEVQVFIIFACAIAGMPGAAERVASLFARAALALEVWIAVEGWKSSGLDDDPDDAVHERLRVTAMSSVGWSATARAPAHEHITGGTPQAHAEAIAAEIDAMLWSTVHAAAWRNGCEDGRRVAKSSSAVKKPAPAATREPQPFPSEDGVVVVPGVSADTTTGGKEALASVRSIVGKPLPLVRGDVAKVAAARAVLVDEFPHAVGVVEALLGDLMPGKPIRFQPCVVLGDSGGGKSRLVRRLLDLLGVGWSVLDAATTTDMGIIGSPRRWASGYPSLPILTIERHAMANPAILVDEIEKAGRSTAGSIHDPLLSLLERSTARAWRDQFLDAEVDVSHVSWLFTANSLDRIPGPLRNRLRILRMPRPGREHVPVIAAQVLRELLRERSVDPRWEPPLDGEEIAAILGAVGEDVSVRDLQRFVVGILDARANGATRN